MTAISALHFVDQCQVFRFELGRARHLAHRGTS
jgi:hypothetical protein